MRLAAFWLWVVYAFVCGMIYSNMPAVHNWQYWLILIALCPPFAISGLAIGEWSKNR